MDWFLDDPVKFVEKLSYSYAEVWCPIGNELEIVKKKKREENETSFLQCGKTKQYFSFLSDKNMWNG